MIYLLLGRLLHLCLNSLKPIIGYLTINEAMAADIKTIYNEYEVKKS